jgi:hypothetical protein
MALEKLGALWKGKTGSKAVLTGMLEDKRRIFVFKNEDKKSDKHPDYRLVVDDGTGRPIAPAPITEDDPPF